MSFDELEEEHPKGLSALRESMRPRGGLCCRALGLGARPRNLQVSSLHGKA